MTRGFLTETEMGQLLTAVENLLLAEGHPTAGIAVQQVEDVPGRWHVLITWRRDAESPAVWAAIASEWIHEATRHGLHQAATAAFARLLVRGLAPKPAAEA